MKNALKTIGKVLFNIVILIACIAFLTFAYIVMLVSESGVNKAKFAVR